MSGLIYYFLEFAYSVFTEWAIDLLFQLLVNLPDSLMAEGGFFYIYLSDLIGNEFLQRNLSVINYFIPFNLIIDLMSAYVSLIFVYRVYKIMINGVGSKDSLLSKVIGFIF